MHAKDKSSSNVFWEKLKPSFDHSARAIFNFNRTEDFDFFGQSEIESLASDKEKFTKAIYDRENSKSESFLDRYESSIENSKKKLEKVAQLVKEVKDLCTQKEKNQKVDSNFF